MPDQHPPPEPHQRGADAVDDELEVGYNRGFESGWHRVEVIGRYLVGAVVLAGLAGLFGRGPLSHHTAATADGSLLADFEPVARFGTSTQLTLHLRPPASQPREVDVRLSSSLVEPLGLETVKPTPIRSWAEGGSLVMRLALPQGVPESLFRLTLTPKVAGPQALTAEVDGGPVLRWTQWIVP